MLSLVLRRPSMYVTGKRLPVICSLLDLLDSGRGLIAVTSTHRLNEVSTYEAVDYRIDLVANHDVTSRVYGVSMHLKPCAGVP